MFIYSAITALFCGFCFLTLELDISSEQVSVNFCAHEVNPVENISYFSEILFVMDWVLWRLILLPPPDRYVSLIANWMASSHWEIIKPGPENEHRLHHQALAEHGVQENPMDCHTYSSLSWVLLILCIWEFMANVGLWPVCCAEKSHTILVDTKQNCHIADGLPELKGFPHPQVGF